jgi:ATP-dependent DNA helicase RecQ
MYVVLNQYFQVAYGELSVHNFEFNLTDFCARYNFNILQTYATLKLLEKEQILSFDEKYNRQSTLKLKVSPDEILNYSKRNNSDIIRTILRSYGGVFEYPVNINETMIAKKSGYTFTTVKKELTRLSNDGFASYDFRKKTSKIQFLVPREDAITIRKIAPNIKQLNIVKLDKINAIIDYVTNEEVCRSSYLLAYFDEKSTENCGICDICVTSVFTDYQQLSVEIMELFSAKQLRSTKEIIAHFSIDKSIILSTLQILLDTNKITITSQNKLEKVTND